MGPFGRKPRRTGRKVRRAASPQVQVGDDPRLDGWVTVEQYEDVATAGAFADRLTELGVPNALTADWEPDRHGHGTIFLQVPGDRYDDATVALEGWDEDV